MTVAEPTEGDRCPDTTCDGELVYLRTSECTCHVLPPCFACTESILTCSVCGHEVE